MDRQSKRLEFLPQAATRQERRKGTASKGRRRSDVVTDLAPQGLVQVSMRLQSPSGPAYNYVFAVSAAGYPRARPPTAALSAGGVEGSAAR